MKKIGKLEIAVGPMFSGKTEWLLSKLRVHRIAKDEILVITHAIDERYGTGEIVSHNNSKTEAKGIKSTLGLKQILAKDYPKVLAIDELQFFNTDLADFLNQLRNDGLVIYATGLDLDYKCSPWDTTARVLAFADSVEKLVAVCSTCRKVNATRTQRLIKDKQKILVGGMESYTARCIKHHKV